MNINYDIIKPKLTEPGIMSYLNDTLKSCHNFKTTYYNYIYNIGLFLLFLVIISLLLIYKYKGKLTPEEIRKNEEKKKKYILTKIYNYQQEKLHAQQSLITGLPHWKNEYDIVLEQIKKM
jgi:sortase (surface protein transpeptidase)